MFLAADDLRHSALLSIYLCGIPERLCGQLDSWLTEKVLAQEWRNQTEKYSLKKNGHQGRMTVSYCLYCYINIYKVHT